MLLYPIVLHANVSDICICQLHESSKYKLSSAYTYLFSMDQYITIDHSNIFWHEKVLLKVNIFSWRLLRNCLPITYNLIKRMLLQPNATLWAGNYCKEEDIIHFFSCDLYIYMISTNFDPPFKKNHFFLIWEMLTGTPITG